MRKTMTDRGVAALKARPKRYAVADPELRGHWIRVQPSGAKTFVAVTRTPSGKQVWHTVAPTSAMAIESARKAAREVLARVHAGLPPVEPAGDSFAAVASNWVKRHVEAKGLRSGKEIQRLLAVHVIPKWGTRALTTIRRSDVAELLDEVEDQHGARQADMVLAVVRSLMNWFAARRDDYNPPIVRAMRRQSTHQQARARILTDDEIRAIWKASSTGGAFGAVVRLLLLTAQRKAKVIGMRWADVAGNEWTIPRAPREKDSAGTLVLPDDCLAIVRQQPQLGDNPHVFAAARGNGPINGLTKPKDRLDAASGTTGWRLHDLRRTARSLMARAGVRPDIAERVMGHVIRGVEGTYDRHSYRDEKADALARLAALIDSIVNPRTADVLPLAKPARRR